MNEVDLELEHFMKSTEHDCYTYKQDNIEWSPYAGVCICWQWLLACVKKFLRGEIRDPHNLIRECHLRSMTNPQQITMDELRIKFFVCKQNIEFLENNGPHFNLKFLKELITSLKSGGGTARASKISGIIKKEASQKRWRRINRSTRKACISLTMAVKVPTSDGGFNEFKTKEGIKGAVPP
jgi:hypothetical protein